MSLDIYIKCRHCDETLFSENITHNLHKMALAANLTFWETTDEWPDQIADMAKRGLICLRADPDYYKAMNPPNGWGNYDVLVAFCTKVIDACREAPTGRVEISR